MGNLITVYKGDENRAKVEAIFSPEDFFGIVYNRAYKTLEKIVKETKVYKEAHKPNGYKIRFQGMGNNTIIFTAERGQGKTSAMQSFAELLRTPGKYSDYSNQMKTVKFYVLDAIDPSALDNKENIIRVLLSRLFFEFDKKYSDSKTLSGESGEMAHDREVLLKLLMDCYDNVKILREDSKCDEDQDDLEHLAQMGNSAKLKENLNNLIEKFLKILQPDNYEDHYLVIQIDDVDLYTGDIYDICEDIHRYFSIPNVIVLMAADYSQLRYALCERYLKQYKELQNERSKVKIFDKCHDMATRYLEKVFPEGHRIELPVLKDMTVEDYINLNILYLDNLINKDDGVNMNEGGLEKKPENLCAYLLQNLYIKTGIIILDTKDAIHPLLPRTMRELTHFLNLLDEMPKIDFIAVCSNIDKRTAEKNADENNRIADEKKAEQERVSLRNNLSRLKQYYLYDWCTNHLDETQWDLIQAIDMCEPQRKLQLTVSLLSEYVNKTNKSSYRFSVSEISYYVILRAIENNKTLQDQVEFQYALIFYYTIFLNEWFAKALGQENSMSRFLDFVGGLIYNSQIIKDCRFNGFRVNAFEVSGDLLMKRIHRVLSEDLSDRSVSWLKAVCMPLKLEDDSTITDKKAVSWINAIWDPEDATNMLYFDTFRLLERILLDPDLRVSTKDFLDAAASQESDTKKDNTFTDDILGTILSVKNIITNRGVQQNIQKRIEKYCKKLAFQDIAKEDIGQYYKKLHAEFDSWLKDTDYFTDIIKSNLEEYLNISLMNNGILNDILLSDDGNKAMYHEQFAENILDVLNRIDDILKKINDVLKEGQITSSEISSFFNPNDIDWNEVRPKLISDYELPDDEQTQQYNKIVQDIKTQYEKHEKMVKEYFLSMGENADSTEDDQSAVTDNESEAEQKRRDLINSISAYRGTLFVTEINVNASRTRKS